VTREQVPVGPGAGRNRAQRRINSQSVVKFERGGKGRFKQSQQPRAPSSRGSPGQGRGPLLGDREGSQDRRRVRLISYPPILRAFTIASACRIAKRASKLRSPASECPMRAPTIKVRIAASSASIDMGFPPAAPPNIQPLLRRERQHLFVEALLYHHRQLFVGGRASRREAAESCSRDRMGAPPAASPGQVCSTATSGSTR
jgi:hypothetical protein